VAEHTSILKNKQNTNYPRFSFTPKTGIGLPETGDLCLLCLRHSLNFNFRPIGGSRAIDSRAEIVTNDLNLPKENPRRVAASAKNHKRQRRKRQSITAKREKSQTPKVSTTILTLPNLTYNLT